MEHSVVTIPISIAQCVRLFTIQSWPKEHAPV